MTVPQIPGVRVRARNGGLTWQVTATNAYAVQLLAACSVGASQVSDLELQVERWTAPITGWVGSPGIAGITALRFAPTARGVELRIATAQPVDASVLVAAALRCLRPFATGDVGPLLTFAPGQGVEAASLASRIVDVLVPGESRDAHVRRCDVLVVPTADTSIEVERVTTVVAGSGPWLRDGVPVDVHVDPSVQRPVGHRSTGGTVATATMAGDLLAVRGADVSIDITGQVTPADARALRGTLAVITDDEVPVRLARQLTSCGVLVRPTSAVLPDPGDALAWQALSIRERRHALRQFGPTAALDAWPTVSVVLATHRPDHLEHALRQVAGLRYPRLEIIVGAHGDAVDAARVWELAEEVPHPLTVLPIEAGRTLGEALQLCSDRAGGALITKMDDDDVYGPEHVWDLVLAREYSGAQVVGKALDWVYLESEDATVFRPTYPAERYADFVAGGTILISRADLLAVGGWRPVPKSVDRALLDRVLAHGGLVYRMHGLGYVYVRHSAGHTAAVKDEHFLTKVVDRHDGLIRHAEFGTQHGLPGWQGR